MIINDHDLMNDKMMLDKDRYSISIGRVNEYPTIHYFGNPRHTQSMVAYMILTEYFWKFQRKIEFWNVVNMPC